MKIADVYGDITMHVRRSSPTDKIVIDEIFNQNVYHVINQQIMGGVVIDAGANIGAFTIDTIRRAKHNGEPVTVYAFEPQPDNLQMLQKNILANSFMFEDSKIVVVPHGLGAKPSSAYITDEHGDSRLSDTGTPIKVLGINEFIKEQDIQEIALFKIDVEGSEVEIIKAMTPENIAKVHYWAIEFDEHSTHGDFTDVIAQLGGICSFSTLGVPARGCYIYAERHIQ